MSLGVSSWSTTAASNGAASSAINFAEGQTPASLNNSGRAVMAELRAWMNALGGAITYGGSSNAYTATNAAAGAWDAYASGQLIALKANHTNSGAATLNVDGLGAKTIKTGDGGDVAAGDLVSGGIYLLAYDGTYFQVLNTLGGGSYQPLDATLTALAALSWSSGSPVVQFTAADTVSLTSALSVTSVTASGALAGATVELGGATDTTLSRSSAGIAAVEGVDLVTVSASQTMTNKTLTSPTINGGTSSAGLQTSSETSGALTSASADKLVVCSGNITLPSSGMTAGEVILIDPGGTARTITRPGSHTMYVDDTDSATATTNAHNIVTAMYHGSSKWTLGGAVA